MTYSFRAMSQGELSVQIAVAVERARDAIGATAWPQAWEHCDSILGHLYQVTFHAGEREYHPLHVEGALYRVLVRLP